MKLEQMMNRLADNIYNTLMLAFIARNTDSVKRGKADYIVLNDILINNQNLVYECGPYYEADSDVVDIFRYANVKFVAIPETYKDCISIVKAYCFDNLNLLDEIMTVGLAEVKKHRGYREYFDEKEFIKECKSLKKELSWDNIFDGILESKLDKRNFKIPKTEETRSEVKALYNALYHFSIQAIAVRLDKINKDK